MSKLDLEQAEEPEIKLPTSIGSLKKHKFQKRIYLCYTDYDKAFDCVDHNNLWKILKEMGIPDHLTCLLRNLYVGQEATEPDIERESGFKSGKVYIKAVYWHPAYLTYMQGISFEMPGWMKHKQETRFLGEISTTSDMPQPQIYHPNGKKCRGTKEPLDECERGEWKSWFKAQYSEN